MLTEFPKRPITKTHGTNIRCTTWRTSATSWSVNDIMVEWLFRKCTKNLFQQQNYFARWFLFSCSCCSENSLLIYKQQYIQTILPSVCVCLHMCELFSVFMIVVQYCFLGGFPFYSWYTKKTYSFLCVCEILEVVFVFIMIIFV